MLQHMPPPLLRRGFEGAAAFFHSISTDISSEPNVCRSDPLSLSLSPTLSFSFSLRPFLHKRSIPLHVHVATTSKIAKGHRRLRPQCLNAERERTREWVLSTHFLSVFDSSVSIEMRLTDRLTEIAKRKKSDENFSQCKRS